MKKFKILSREKVLDSQWCPIEKQIVELPNGKETEWFVHMNADAVIVVPILKNGNILLQKNYKHGCGECITEFCAGMIDKGESPEKCAHREFLEETGFQTKKLVKIGEVFANPTGSIMKYHFFLGFDCEKIANPQQEESEQIEVFEVENLKAAHELLTNSNTKTSSATLTALLLAQKRVDNL
ncbi:NUDIX hydrolase [Candidatus Gracilibacteria bacterium]|nr:NUDIX hydrolase [Candidatus Gracilibacteria bacterium]